MFIDVNGLRDEIEPKLSDAKKYLKEAKGKLASIKIPTDFIYRQGLRAYADEALPNLISMVTSIEVWLDD